MVLKWWNKQLAMQLARQEAELLFRLISERYEHSSVILTSNKYFSDWGELLSDNVIATALLDRLLHHAYVINIWSQTYHLKDRLKAGIQTVPPAEILAEQLPALEIRRFCYPSVGVIFRPAFSAIAFRR